MPDDLILKPGELALDVTCLMPGTKTLNLQMGHNSLFDLTCRYYSCEFSEKATIERFIKILSNNRIILKNNAMYIDLEK